jgi:hypothetical protein
MKSTRQEVARLGLAAVSLASAGWVMAEINPYYVGVSEAYTRESNLFRVANGQPKTSDNYWTTSLLGGIDQPFGRQRFFADATARYNKYKDNTQIDNTGYGLAVGLDWETIERLSGRFSYTLDEKLARFGADQGPLLFKKNLEKSQELLARAKYGLVSLLSLEGSLSHRRLDYSADEFAFQEFQQDSASLGLQYRPSGLLTLGSALRYTKGRYPFAVQASPGVFQQDDFHRNDLDLTAVWVPTGLSTVSARLSFTRESHDAVASRDVSGATGALSWEYKPTGKLAFTTSLIRDTGAEASFGRLSAGGVNPIGNNSRLSNSLETKAVYEATAKIKVDANARYVERNLVNTFALASGAASTEAGSDKYAEARLGVSYAPIRSVLLGCALGYEKRGSRSTVSYGYSANTVGCLAQFKLQQ